MSVLLEFEKLNNTRDLGTMPAEGGSIRSGLLYRSGFLKKASENDRKRLEELNLSAIVDFRSASEVMEQADPVIGKARNIHLPAEDEESLGIERDEESKKRVGEIIIDRVIADPSYSLRYMMGLYRRFISNPFTVGQYRKFMKLVLEEKGPILWHCTAGKDRAGFAAILLEEILGADRDDIREDYLMTNTYVEEEVHFLVDLFEKMRPENYPKKEVRQFFQADNLYFDAIYDEADKVYGSFEQYLEKALGIDEQTRQILKERYLV